MLIGLLHGHVAPDLAGREGAVRIARPLAGEEDEIADPLERDVVRQGLRRRWQREPHGLQFVFSAHASILLNLPPRLGCHHLPATTTPCERMRLSPVICPPVTSS